MKPGDLVRISESIEPVRREYWGYYAGTAGLYLETWDPGSTGRTKPISWASVDFGAKGIEFVPHRDLEVLNEAS